MTTATRIPTDATTLGLRPSAIYEFSGYEAKVYIQHYEIIQK